MKFIFWIIFYLNETYLFKKQIFFIREFHIPHILSYMRQDRYTTRFIHPVCINLEPEHFDFLLDLANQRFYGNLSDTIFYLLNKYLNPLYDIRITPTKQTETATYQPRTKKYKRRVIHINPVIWSKLFETRHFVGYSMSAILRIMLDWEMLAMGYEIIPLIPLPDLHTHTDDMTIEKNINNYFYLKQGFYHQRNIFSIFLDEFY